MPISITLPQKHGQTFPPPQAPQSPPPLLLTPASALPSPSTTPMPSSVPLEHPPSEEKPSSTALMAQTSSPQTVPPLAPPFLLGVPSPTPQTNQSPPLLVTPASALSVALNDTYALIGASQPTSSTTGDAFLYRLDGSDAFTSTCATTGTDTSPLTSPWCTLSQSTDEPTTSLAANSRFGISVALTATYALIGANAISTSRGDAFLYRLDGSDAFTSTCATTGTSTSPWCTLSESTDQPITSLANNSNFGTSVALNDTYALIGATQATSNRGDAYLYRLDGSDAFTSTCATTATSTSPWCTLSQSTDQPITSLAVGSFFGRSVALNDTYALIGATQAISFRGEAFLYRIDGTNAFNSSCQIAGTTTPWCAIVADAGLSLINNSLTSGNFLTGSYFGESVALSNTTIIISARRATGISQGNAFLLPFVVLTPIDTTTTTFFTSTQVQTMLSTNNVTIMANNDITILSSFTYTGTNTLTLTSGGTINANPLNIQSSTTLPTITAPTLTINASGNIGSTTLPLSLIFTSLNINAGTNSVFLAHPTDILTYLPATIASSNLSLTQTTGDINITSAIILNGFNLTLNAVAGAILTTLTATAITAADITLTAAGNIGSSTNPFILTTTGALTINAGTNSVFLAHPSDVSTYLPLSGTAGSLSLTQTTGDINITSAITLPTTNLTLNAAAGAILTTLTATAITANNLTLTAAGNIGSSTNPFILTTTGALTINAGTNSVFLAHPSDASIYLPLTGTAGSLSLTQTTGDINITSAITLPTTNLTLNAAAGAILTTLTATAITANNLTLTAAGNIGSSTNPFILTTTGALTINAGTNSVFLAHPSDAFAYLSATITSSLLSLTQTTGDINITSAITLPTTNLTLNAAAGAILTTLTATAITANNLTLTAAGNIGSSTNPFILTTTGALTINAGTNSVFLAHPSDVSTYLPLSGTAGSLSLTQTTGDINITSAITLPTTNLTLNAAAGAILTTLTATAITANNLTLTAAGNIGSSTNPFILTTTGALTINAGTNSVFLAHPSDASIYLPLTGTAGSLSLTQTTGDINIASAITLPTTNLTLNATAGAITTSLTTPAITANNLTITAAGNIGSSTNPFILTTTGALTINAGTNPVFLAHPTDIFTYLSAVITSSNLSLTQTTGDINITSAINLPTTNLTLTAPAGAITTSLTTPAITAIDISLTANGDIGSTTDPIGIIFTGTAILDAGTNDIYLSHPTDIFTYLSAVITSSNLSLTQTTGDINITSTINLSLDSIEVIAQSGNISTTLTLDDTLASIPISLIAVDGDIGSPTNPITITLTNDDTISASNNIYLSHPTNLTPLFAPTIIANNLIATQTTGDINITSAITLPMASVDITATAGAITTSIIASDAITARAISLTASNGDIGSPIHPLSITSISETITLNAGTNDIYLIHQDNLAPALTSNITATNLIADQITGAINITSTIYAPLTTISLFARNGGISIGSDITSLQLDLQAQGPITTTSSNNKITTPSLIITSRTGDIGTETERLYISTGFREPNFTSLRIYTAADNGSVYIRRDQNTISSTSADIQQHILRNIQPSETNTFTITIFDTASEPFNQSRHLRLTINPPPIEISEGFIVDILDIFLGLFNDDCNDDDSDIEAVSDTLQTLCL